MSTLQAQRPQEKQVNWEAIFPNEQVTETKSALFVKKLLAVAISNITYLRNIFPENAFGDKCLEDLNLKILRDQSSCPGACQVIKWVKGCFDALDKKYLKTLVIGIYVDPNDPETIVESYTFKFSYKDDGSVDIYRNDKKISEAYNAEDTKKATIRLLRTLIILTNTLSSLPDKVMMTMKLYYYDDVTPEDYEPPGFKASDDGDFGYQEEATNIAIGSVATSFHTVKLRIKTSSTQFEMHEEDQPATNNNGFDNEIQEIICEDPDRANAEPDTSVVNEDDFKVRCPCGCNEDDGLMIMCANCKFWQHGVCFLITNEGKAPEAHTCDICAKPGDALLEPTDPTLCGMTSIAVQGTCLWRRALTVCTEFKKILPPQFARRLSIETTVAQGLINRLEKEGFISTSARGKKLGKQVNKGKIESEGIPHYLKTPKALRNKVVSDDFMDTGDCDKSEDPVNQDNQNNIINKDINTLTDSAKKLSLEGKKRKSRRSPAQVNTSLQDEKKGTRSRKRAYSRTNEAEFEISSSPSAPVSASKKKASKTSKDIIV